MHKLVVFSGMMRYFLAGCYVLLINKISHIKVAYHQPSEIICTHFSAVFLVIIFINLVHIVVLTSILLIFFLFVLKRTQSSKYHSSTFFLLKGTTSLLRFEILSFLCKQSKVPHIFV